MIQSQQQNFTSVPMLNSNLGGGADGSMAGIGRLPSGGAVGVGALNAGAGQFDAFNRLSSMGAAPGFERLGSDPAGFGRVPSLNDTFNTNFADQFGRVASSSAAPGGVDLMNGLGDRLGSMPATNLAGGLNNTSQAPGANATLLQQQQQFLNQQQQQQQQAGSQNQANTNNNANNNNAPNQTPSKANNQQQMQQQQMQQMQMQQQMQQMQQMQGQQFNPAAQQQMLAQQQALMQQQNQKGGKGGAQSNLPGFGQFPFLQGQQQMGFMGQNGMQMGGQFNVMQQGPNGHMIGGYQGPAHRTVSSEFGRAGSADFINRTGSADGQQWGAQMPNLMGSWDGQQDPNQWNPSMQSSADQDSFAENGKGGKGKKGKKGAAGGDAKGSGTARKRKAAAISGNTAEAGNEGVERHNQFLWAKRMGQQNEPRWGLFKKGGSAGPAFLSLLEDLERDGIVQRMFAQNVPENLGGVSGWTVKEGMMDEWHRRRKAWFMEGKEGKEYKPNSFYQILRRLGFFPTMRSSRAGHGYDFEASNVFQWDPERKYVQRRGKTKADGNTATQ